MENARAFSKRRERFLTLYIMQDNSSKVEHLIIIFSHYEIILYLNQKLKNFIILTILTRFTGL